MDSQTARLAAMTELSTVKADIREMASALDEVPLWRPATGLKAACDEALVLLDQLTERFDRKLVVTLVGPSGSGKSTLINALSGDDALSPSGRQRPTTRQVVVFCKHRADADHLVEGIGPENIRVQARDTADALDHVILIDTPDTDSTHQDQHIPIIEQTIALSDVLICVFDGENPKRRDHTDFMTPYVHRFNGKSLVVVVNKADRLDQTELTQTILPEFSRYIVEVWSAAPSAILCVSARSHLQQPRWSENVRPRHSYDQFEDLRRLIAETFNQSGFSVDRRLENARELKTWLHHTIQAAAEKQTPHLQAAVEQLAAAETEALSRAVKVFQEDGDKVATGINVRLYQYLAQRWLGPVGWVVAVWARILVFGTGIMALLRFGNPLSQMAGAFSTVRQYGESRKNLEAADTGVGAGLALAGYESAMVRIWPDIAEKLINAGFSSRIRDDREAPGSGEILGREIGEMWNAALDQELARVGHGLCSGWLQLVFNLPVLGVMGYAGWLTAVNFFTGPILPGDFFVHAIWTLILILFLSFFLLQGVIRLAAGKKRLVERVFSRLQTRLDPSACLAENPVWQQARKVMALKK
ncbi:50S ribosome-binding GTPase [Desulfosarcina sp. OttesenSCG-928-B08]|nr:50S ribosome-binding GTPase [Desulfosarcina sp. OttesenSCG-928-B08]